MINGRAKGCRGELEVAKLVEAWWRQLEPECRFLRVPLSGGWSTPQVRGDTMTSGDLVTTARLFPWSVEIKHRNSWSEREFLAGRRSPVWGWWEQAIKQAEEMGKVPSLWFRRNRAPWRVLLPQVYSQAVLVPALGAWERGWGHKLPAWVQPVCWDAGQVLRLPPSAVQVK